MLSKRDLQFVRLACKWRWLTAEEGEDLLFLKRKFGAKLAIEEIARRRGYLDAKEIDQLATAASRAGGRRARPVFESEEPSPRATSHVATSPGPTEEVGGVRLSGARDVTAFMVNPLATIMEGRSPLIDPAALGLKRAPIPEVTPMPSDDVVTGSAGFDSPDPMPVMGGERTIIAPMPDAVRFARLRQQMDDEDGPTATNLDRDALLDGRLSEPVMPVDLDDEEEEFDRTIFDSRRPIIAPSVIAESDVTADPAPIPLPLDALSIVEADPAERPPIDGGKALDPREFGSHTVSLLAQVSVSDAFHDGRMSMPGESLASIVLSEPLDQDVTADAYQLADLDNEAAAHALLGPFGAYSLERIIALGSRSVVYLGVHVESGHPLAIKVLYGDPRACAQMLAERGEDMLAAAPVRSDNIVRVVDIGRVESRYYVALDYVDGWTLSEKLAAGERPSAIESLSIVRDVARALADAEVHGVVHKDIRPGNVLLAPDRAMLTGFGLAKVTDGVMGSMAFIAPECFHGAPPSHTTDIYALGVMLYRLLTGEMPFFGEDARAMAAAALAMDPPDVRTYDPEIPASVAVLVARMLSRDPQFRGSSCADVAQVLEQLTFDLEAEGLLASDAAQPPPPLRPIMLRAAAFGLGVAAVSVSIPMIVKAIGFVSLARSFLLDSAFLGAFLSIVATLLLATLALIRRGEIPLPMSSAWLVRVEEVAGAVGTAFLVGGIVIAPPAILNLFVSFLAAIVLASWIFGVLLRRTIALRRDDGGVGRILAVLGDPSLTRWRVIHAPLLSALTCLATVRFMLLAYFSAG